MNDVVHREQMPHWPKLWKPMKLSLKHDGLIHALFSQYVSKTFPAKMSLRNSLRYCHTRECHNCRLWHIPQSHYIDSGFTSHFIDISSCSRCTAASSHNSSCIYPNQSLNLRPTTCQTHAIIVRTQWWCVRGDNCNSGKLLCIGSGTESNRTTDLRCWILFPLTRNYVYL